MDIEKIKHLLSLNYSLDDIFELDNGQLAEYKEAIELQAQLKVITMEELSLDTSLINERLDQLKGFKQKLPTWSDIANVPVSTPTSATLNEYLTAANTQSKPFGSMVEGTEQYTGEHKDLASALVELLTTFNVLSPVAEEDDGDDYWDTFEDDECDCCDCDEVDYIDHVQDSIFSLIRATRAYKDALFAETPNETNMAAYHERYSNVAISLPIGMDKWSIIADIANNDDIIIAVDEIPEGLHTDAATITTDMISRIPAIPSHITVGNVFVIFTDGFNKSSFAEIYNKFSNNPDQVFVLVS